MSISTNIDRQLIEVFRSRIRELVEPAQRGHIRRGQFQKDLCASLNIKWRPQLSPYINVAMQLEGYASVLVDGWKMYKHVQYKQPSASD